MTFVNGLIVGIPVGAALMGLCLHVAIKREAED